MSTTPKSWTISIVRWITRSLNYKATHGCRPVLGNKPGESLPHELSKGTVFSFRYLLKWRNAYHLIVPVKWAFIVPHDISYPKEVVLVQPRKWYQIFFFHCEYLKTDVLSPWPLTAKDQRFCCKTTGMSLRHIGCDALKKHTYFHAHRQVT